jgi:hypothetical protein
MAKIKAKASPQKNNEEVEWESVTQYWSEDTVSDFLKRGGKIKKVKPGESGRRQTDWTKSGSGHLPANSTRHYFPKTSRARRKHSEEFEPIEEAASRSEKAEYKKLMNKYGSKPITKIPWETFRKIEKLGVKVRGDENVSKGATVGDMLRKSGKLKEARGLTPAQRFLKKKAEAQATKDDPKAFDPGANRYQRPTSKHVGIIKDREKAKKDVDEDVDDRIDAADDRHDTRVDNRIKRHKQTLKTLRQRHTSKKTRIRGEEVSFVDEESPPSEKAERFINKNKAGFQERYGEDWKEVLYATAWKMHNKHFSKDKE